MVPATLYLESGELANALFNGRMEYLAAPGEPKRIVEGEALNPVWSPSSDLIVYTGPQVNVVSPLLAVRPDGSPVELPSIEVFRWGERVRFLPSGTGFVFMQGNGPDQDFWLLDLTTMDKRRLTDLEGTNTMLTFDITPDGKEIVFDRLSEETDIVLIELAERDEIWPQEITMAE